MEYWWGRWKEEFRMVAVNGSIGRGLVRIIDWLIICGNRQVRIEVITYPYTRCKAL